MSSIRDARPPMQDLDLSAPVTFLCYSDSGAHGPVVLHFDKGKYIYDRADMSAKIMMPGIESDECLTRNAVEGALFHGGLGGSSDVFWMIDPKYRRRDAPMPDIDQKVGWATVTIPSAGPGNTYSCWPVRSANGQRVPLPDYRPAYYIQEPRTARRPYRSPAPRRRESNEKVIIRYYSSD
ncbi:hypothetical protein LTS15_002096 [Exophiala xenobiotica]|nr:hypothetical protein LTS15_002096 [Exophiala xenobiotica]